jgi:Flp pilus assembly protein TadG
MIWRSERGCRDRGSVAVELAFGLPVLLFVVLSGIGLGRTMLTRHRLADASSYATRAAAVAGIISPDAVRGLVQTRLGVDLTRCAALTVDTTVLPADVTGARALRVTTRCALAPVFDSETLSVLLPDDLTVVSVMPL